MEDNKNVCYRIAECTVTIEQMKQFFPDVEPSELIGYIDENGNGEFEDDESVIIGDEVEDGVIVFIKDLCHNWYEHYTFPYFYTRSLYVTIGMTIIHFHISKHALFMSQLIWPLYTSIFLHTLSLCHN